MLNIQRTITGVEPLTLDEVKSWLRVEYSADDALLLTVITEVRGLAEEWLNRSLVDSSIVAEGDARESLFLPYGPDFQINYLVDEAGDPIQYTVEVGDIWFPIPTNFTLAYDTTASVPPGLKLVLMQLVAFVYENRGDEIELEKLVSRNKNLQVYRTKTFEI